MGSLVIIPPILNLHLTAAIADGRMTRVASDKGHLGLGLTPQTEFFSFYSSSKSFIRIAFKFSFLGIPRQAHGA